MYAEPRKILLLVLAPVLLCGSGCFNTVLIASPDAHVTTLDNHDGEWFHVQTKNNFTFWGVRPRARAIEVDRVVAEQLGRDVARINGLRVQQVTTFKDGFLSAITLGIYSPRTLIIQGRLPAPDPDGLREDETNNNPAAPPDPNAAGD